MRRVVLLGASNLTRGIATVVRLSRGMLEPPLEIMAAFGHGRSYGMESSVMGRTLPPLNSCGLWRDLEQRPASETWGLVTDIGNDILYGASVEQISSWVDDCVSRLVRHAQRVVITELPMESICSLSIARFNLMRKILFPRSRMSLENAIEQVQKVNQSVKEIADHHRASLIRQRSSWFGFDPIHILPRHWHSAWQEILSPWRDPDARHEVSPSSPSQWWTLRIQSPQYRRVFGIPQWKAQPCARLRDGSQLSYY